MVCYREYKRILADPNVETYSDVGADSYTRMNALWRAVREDRTAVELPLTLRYLADKAVFPSVEWAISNRDAFDTVARSPLFGNIAVAAASRELPLDTEWNVVSATLTRATKPPYDNTDLFGDLYELVYHAVEREDSVASMMLDEGWALNGMSFEDRKAEIQELNDDPELAPAAAILFFKKSVLADPHDSLVKQMLVYKKVSPGTPLRHIAYLMKENSFHEIISGSFHGFRELLKAGVPLTAAGDAALKNPDGDWGGMDDVVKAFTVGGVLCTELVVTALGIGD